MKIGKIELHNPFRVLDECPGTIFAQGCTLFVSLVLSIVASLIIIIYIGGFWALIALPIIRVIYAILKGV